MRINIFRYLPLQSSINTLAPSHHRHILRMARPPPPRHPLPLNLLPVPLVRVQDVQSKRQYIHLDGGLQKSPFTSWCPPLGCFCRMADSYCLGARYYGVVFLCGDWCFVGDAIMVKNEGPVT